MECITYGKSQIEYSVKRSRRRKTLAISITPNAQVVVSVPHILSNVKIKDIIKKKAEWILRKKEYFNNLALRYPDKEYVSGEQILFLGRRYRLKLIEKPGIQTVKTVLKGRRIFISANSQLSDEGKRRKIKDALIKWYFSEAAKIITQRAKRYGEILDIVPHYIKIKEQRRRWGSCSSNGALRFNWKIAMAPVSIIDYVVVHELSHMKVKNHSPRFWKQVSLAIPNYQKSRKWLRDNAGMLKLSNTF